MRRAVAVLALFAVLRVEADERPIETFGDSLTQGFLTNSYVEMSSPDQVKSILTGLITYFVTKDKKHMVPHVHPDLAWPRYLSDLMERDSGRKFPVHNYAISGARTMDMLGQVLNAPVQPTSPITFFFIGHNDLCSNVRDPEDLGNHFSKEFEASLALWDARNQGATAYLVPVGEVHQVYETLKDYVWYTGAFGEYRCENSWRTYFPYCRKNYKMAQEGKLRDHLEPRITSMNSHLERLAEHWSKLSTRNRYRYLSEVQHLDMRPRHFAVDCYHLSSTGQRELAEHIYDAIRNDF